MRQTRSVAKKATGTVGDEIAHLRDLDLHGLRARWKGMFRQQPPPHLPRHLLFAVLAYQLQADELGDLDPATARLLRQIATSGGTFEVSRLTEEFGRRRAESRWLAGARCAREFSKNQIDHAFDRVAGNNFLRGYINFGPAALDQCSVDLFAKHDQGHIVKKIFLPQIVGFVEMADWQSQIIGQQSDNE
jgi:hypothetical protein